MYIKVMSVVKSFYLLLSVCKC